MIPIKTPFCNFTYTAPPGTEETVMDLPCRRDDGVTTSWWQPSPEELIAISMGCPVKFQVFGSEHPVIGLGVASIGAMGCEPLDMEKAEHTAMRCAQIIHAARIDPGQMPVVLGVLVHSMATLCKVRVETAITAISKVASTYQEAGENPA